MKSQNLQLQKEELGAAYKAVTKTIKETDRRMAMLGDMRPILRASAPDRCDVRIGWVLTGAKTAWNSSEWIRYVETSIDSKRCAKTVGQMARAQAGENVNSEQYRAR